MPGQSQQQQPEVSATAAASPAFPAASAGQPGAPAFPAASVSPVAGAHQPPQWSAAHSTILNPSSSAHTLATVDQTDDGMTEVTL